MEPQPDRPKVVPLHPPSESEPRKTTAPSPKRPFFKSGVFWAAFTALVTLLAVVLTIFQTTKSRDEKIRQLQEQASLKMGPIGKVEATESMSNDALKNLAEANNLLANAYKLKRRDAKTLALQGVYHLKMGQLAPAEKKLLRALDLDPKLSKAHCALGVVYLLRDQLHLERATEKFEEAIKWSPQDPLPHMNIAVVLRRTGKLSGAIEHLEKATFFDPKISVFWEELGVTYQLQRNFLKAREALTRAVDVDPTNASALYSLGEILRASDQNAQAEAMFMRAIEAQPNLKQVYPVLGLTLDRQDRSEEALRKLNECTTRWPDNADCYEALGLVYQHRNENRKAIAAWLKASELDPGDIEVWRLLVQALQREAAAPGRRVS